jgi:hypothetical protein
VAIATNTIPLLAGCARPRSLAQSRPRKPGREQQTQSERKRRARNPGCRWQARFRRSEERALRQGVRDELRSANPCGERSEASERAAEAEAGRDETLSGRAGSRSTEKGGSNVGAPSHAQSSCSDHGVKSPTHVAPLPSPPIPPRGAARPVAPTTPTLAPGVRQVACHVIVSTVKLQDFISRGLCLNPYF